LTAPRAAEAADPVWRAVGPDGLPVYRFEVAGRSVFYVPATHPATVVSPEQGDVIERALAGDCQPPEPLAGMAAALRQQARSVLAEMGRRRDQPYEPECLTLLLTNSCNLRCPYCHCSAGSSPDKRLPLGAIREAAHVVAAICARKALPFTAVFHGGGEPTLYPELLRESLDVLRGVASEHSLRLFSYVATNGLMSQETATWLARNVDLVGLSCDGPPEIQQRQRPALRGDDSSRTMAATAATLRAEGCAVTVRATVTARSVGRLSDCVDEFARTFAPTRISFEPLYRRGRATAGALLSPAPDVFVAELRRARGRGAQLGIEVEFPDCCPEELHGRPCHTNRAVLCLTPEARVSACFDVVEDRGGEDASCFIGAWEPGRTEPIVDRGRLELFRTQVTVADANCESCFNRFHCARACPELCPRRCEDPAGNARCRAALLWAYHSLLERAGVPAGLV
jgi:sulfatase maturation enzyme AslB (radical SAM superfamily)